MPPGSEGPCRGRHLCNSPQQARFCTRQPTQHAKALVYALRLHSPLSVPLPCLQLCATCALHESSHRQAPATTSRLSTHALMSPSPSSPHAAPIPSPPGHACSWRLPSRVPHHQRPRALSPRNLLESNGSRRFWRLAGKLPLLCDDSPGLLAGLSAWPLADAATAALVAADAFGPTVLMYWYLHHKTFRGHCPPWVLDNDVCSFPAPLLSMYTCQSDGQRLLCCAVCHVVLSLCNALEDSSSTQRIKVVQSTSRQRCAPGEACKRNHVA